jgi:hypothetical protein
MIIKEFNTHDLEVFIDNVGFSNSDIIPITTLRALSQIQNPRSNINDVLLLVAYDDNAIAGYIGILPDKMFIDNKEIKIGWISCWWTDVIKGKTIALELFYKAMELWSHNILITDMIPKTKYIMDKTEEFFYPQTTVGLRCFIKFNLATILSGKSKFFKSMVIPLRLIDLTGNSINNIRLNLLKASYKRRMKKLNINIEYIENIDNEINNYIINHQQNELICRGKAELEWIKNFPWIADSEQSKHESEKYYFSSYCKYFKNGFIKICRDHELIGFMMTSIRDRHFKIPYLYFEKGNIQFISLAIYYISISGDCTIFTTFNLHLTEYIKYNTSPYFYKRKLFKDLAVSTKYRNLNFDNIILQDGDGDCAFT